MIEAKNLTKDYGNFRAADNVSFTVEKGDILGFLGPNGAGKSTTMKMLTGFLSPTGGTGVIGGNDIQQNPLEAKRLFGYLPESGPLYTEMTVKEFLTFIAEIRGYHDKDAAESVIKTPTIAPPTKTTSFVIWPNSRAINSRDSRLGSRSSIIKSFV